MSKPFTSFAGAHLDLLRLLPRLLSERADARSWEAYLDSIDWNNADHEA
jgi:hypothetical protein